METNLYDRNGFIEYMSGAQDIVVAALTHGLEKQMDSCIGLETKEYATIVYDMYEIALEEYNERNLSWELYEETLSGVDIGD